MSKGILDRTTFETIEAYVLDRLSTADRAAFEERMAADAELCQEVALQQEHIRAVELGGFLRTVQQAGTAHATPARGGPRPNLWRYAAMVALILAAAAWWLARPSNNERLFAEHFRPDPGLPVAMGTTTDPVFADAMVSYKEGAYAKARGAWMTMLRTEPTNDTLQYYIASSLLAEEHVAEAIPLLEILATNADAAFRDRARWYLFLAYIRTGRTAEALAMPLEDDPSHGAQVRTIKQRLEP
jgi:hypothetical protein